MTQKSAPAVENNRPLFRRLFVANRGEVAARIARACDDLGIVPVFGVSQADLEAPYLRGREFVLLGPARAAQSYLDPVKLVQAAKQMRCSALHPGWGFLSESPLLAGLCATHGITFVGPSAQVMSLMGKKTPAKDAMRKAGLALIPGSAGILGSYEEAESVAAEVGYPVLLKAESGGGGRGMRIAREASQLRQAYDEAQAEARAAFGDPRLYLERLIEGGRHVEVQIIADRYGNAVHVGERDCTVQRNHQKLIEESPSPVLPESERQRAFAKCVHAVRSIGYVGAGTFEFLLDHDGTLRFMEMNTRLQVEHPVSEMRSGLDLMREMICVAAGRRLSFAQESFGLAGHAIECRINAEDPSDNFRPSPGVVSAFVPPSGEGIRIDTHVESGYEVSPHYDSLLCKIIVQDSDREKARLKMIQALRSFLIEGVKTTIPLHIQMLESKSFAENRYDTRTLPLQ